MKKMIVHMFDFDVFHFFLFFPRNSMASAEINGFFYINSL